MQAEARALSQRIIYLNQAYLEIFKMSVKYLKNPGEDMTFQDLRKWHAEKKLLIESLELLINDIERPASLKDKAFTM